MALLFVKAMGAGIERLDVAAQTPDPRERLIALIRGFVDEMADHPSLVRHSPGANRYSTTAATKSSGTKTRVS